MGRALAIAASLGFAFGAWLAAPLHGPGSGRPLRIAVFDRSASVDRTRPGIDVWMRSAAEKERERARAEGSDFAALVFAGDLAWWLPPGSVGRELKNPPHLGRTLESELAAALDLAREDARSFCGDSGGVVRLFSDGRNTGPALTASVRSLTQAGLRLERGELAPAELDDIALVSLRAPPRLEQGAALACELHVEAELARGADGRALDFTRSVRIEFLLTSAAQPRRLSFERQLESGANNAIWRFDLGPAPAGGVRIAAQLFLEGDPIPENDSKTVRVDVEGALEIAVVTPEAQPGLEPQAREGSAFTSDEQLWPGIIFTLTSLEALPAALDHVKAVLTLDVDSRALPKKLLRQFLDVGGAWLDCAGSAALRESDATSADRTGARELLPLSPEAPARKPRDVLLLIDGSGSMAGTTFDAVRAAALTLSDVVPPQDRLLLAFFTRELEPVRVLRDAHASGSQALDLALLLRARSPGGGTDVLGALEQLARTRTGESNQMQALLLSDGRDPQAEQQRDLSPLRASLAAARIELAVFAFGPDADLNFLSSLLSAGRQLTRVEDAAQLGALFARSVDSERTRNATAAVAGTRDSFTPGSFVHDLAGDLFSGAPSGIERAWIARARDDASVLWRTVEGDPLLAIREQGRGFSAAFASLPVEGWAKAARAPSALGPLLRVLARGRGEREALPRAAIEDGILWIRGLSPTLPATLAAGYGTAVELALEPPTMQADEPRTTRCGRISAEILADLARAGRSCVFELRSGTDEPIGSVALELPQAGEFTLPQAQLDGASAAAGSDASPRSQQRHPAAPWVLLASLGLLCAGLLLGLGTR